MKRAPKPHPLRAALLACLLLTATPSGAAETAQGPVTLYADHVEAMGTDHWVAMGNVEVLYGDRTLYADRVRYDRVENEIVATGHVKLVSPGLITEAPEAKVHLSKNQGYVLKPRFTLPAQDGHGTASVARQTGKGRYEMEETCYTTCAGERPAWQIRAGTLWLDQTKGTISTRNARLDFFGLPVFWLPYFSFPLERHSGVLAPSFGQSTINGFSLGIPYYFDIAPNLDDTLTARYFTKRGFMVQNQFRYLEPSYSGTLFFDLLPNDSLTHNTLWAVSWQHQQDLGHGFSLDVNYNRVSYAGFLSDFGATSGFGTGYLGGIGNAPYIPAYGSVNYNSAHIQAGVGLTSYQELAPSAVPPYAQLPHVYLDGYWNLWPGTYTDLHSTFDYFNAATGVIGQRLNVVPTVGWRVSQGWGFLEPKARLYYTRYQLQRTLPGQARVIDRALPALSLKGGLTFVRYGEDGSTALLQPMFKYLYIPTQDQSQIPAFDSSAPFLNFPMIFRDNQYSGWDRINGADWVALGLTGTWLTPSGRQLWQLSAGQLRRFNQLQVDPITGALVPETSQSPYFFEGSLAPAPDIYLLVSSQVQHQFHRFERLNLRAQWLPGPNRVLNLDYRYTEGFVDQVGISGAWPIGKRWQVLGSYQYGISTHKSLEQLAGIGYDGGCWGVRVYAYHQILLGGQSNDAVYFEVLLRGLTTLGNTRGLLSQYVPGANVEF